MMSARRLERRLQIDVGAFPQSERFAVTAEYDDGLALEQCERLSNVVRFVLVEYGVQ